MHVQTRSYRDPGQETNPRIIEGVGFLLIESKDSRKQARKRGWQRRVQRSSRLEIVVNWWWELILHQLSSGGDSLLSTQWTPNQLRSSLVPFLHAQLVHRILFLFSFLPPQENLWVLGWDSWILVLELDKLPCLFFLFFFKKN